MEPKCRILVYRGTENLGDTIQSIAISRLLPQAVGVLRDERDFDQRADLPAVINGFLKRPLRKRLGDNCLFAGIHLNEWDTPIPQFLPWLAASPWPIGARDPWTERKLRATGFENVVMVGCPTMTLPRYEGPRLGEISVDVDGPGERLTHNIGKLTIHEEWDRALKYLERYRKARQVTTNRLHVSVPCLAYGTPVKFIRVAWRHERLTLLDHLGIKDGQATVTNIATPALRYVAFLKQHLGAKLLDRSGETKMPILKGVS